MKLSKAFILFAATAFLSVSSVFAQVDVARKTNAVTYPLDEEVMIRFRGTTRFPRMKGEATIKRSGKRGTLIDLSVSKMPRPFELGAGYATYVLWAISPNGQVDNLGEIKRRGFWEFDSKIKVTTPLQTFALIITAEPHFLVSRPSQEIMLENLNPYTRSGRSIATTTAIQYFGNSSDYFRDARTPQIADVDYKRTPTAVLQARQAVALARFAGAERDALDELQQAEVLLNNAENAWQAGRDEDYVDIAARKSISQAVQAETTATIRKAAREQRNEKMRRDSELRAAENRVEDAQSDIESLRSELDRETRARELAERDALNYSNQVKQLRAELDSLRRESEEAKIKLAAAEARQEALREEREKESRIARLKAESANLKRSLSQFGIVDESESGIVLTLDETYWTGIRVSSFSEASGAKLEAIGKLIAENSDYNVSVEAHTDNSGDPAALNLLTEERARAITDKFMSLGVGTERLSSKGYGPKAPIASNGTRANRAKNRRVQIVLTPNIK